MFHYPMNSKVFFVICINFIRPITYHQYPFVRVVKTFYYEPFNSFNFNYILYSTCTVVQCCSLLYVQYDGGNTVGLYNMVLCVLYV